MPKLKSLEELQKLRQQLQGDIKARAETSTTITWQTNEPATSQVTICSSDGCISTEPGESLITDHSATLTDVKPNTKYQLTVISIDKHKNEARLELELITPSEHYAIPLIISEIQISNTTDSSVIVSWQTDRPATSQVEYGENDTYDLITTPDKTLATNHSITLTGLEANTTYGFKVKSEDVAGNKTTSEAETFITLSTSATAVEVGPEIGKCAPDFTLPSIDGKELSLSQFRGKIVMVNFWQSSCSNCREEMPHLQTIYQQWPRDKLEILAVSVSERAAFVQSFAEWQGLTFPVLLDSDEVAYESYQISRFPTTFFVNSNGIIKEIKRGAFENQFEIGNILKSL